MRETNSKKRYANAIDSQKEYIHSRSNNNVCNYLSKMPKLLDNIPDRRMKNSDSKAKKIPYYYNDTVLFHII